MKKTDENNGLIFKYKSQTVISNSNSVTIFTAFEPFTIWNFRKFIQFLYISDAPGN